MRRKQDNSNLFKIEVLDRVPVEQVAVPTPDGRILEVDGDVVVERDNDLLGDEVALSETIIAHAVSLIMGSKGAIEEAVVSGIAPTGPIVGIIGGPEVEEGGWFKVVADPYGARQLKITA